MHNLGNSKEDDFCHDNAAPKFQPKHQLYSYYAKESGCPGDISRLTEWLWGAREVYIIGNYEVGEEYNL